MGKKIAFLLAVGAALVAAFPNLYGEWKTPPGGAFLWSGYPWDSNQYFAFMRTGYRGDWLLTNLLTSEPHPPVLLMPFFVALGHAARWYRDFLTWREGQAPFVTRTIPAVYNSVRVVLIVPLFLLIYWLAGQITTRRSRRLWIVAFAAFAGGVRWGPAQDIFTDSHVLKSCILFPNFVAALILYVCACGAFLMALHRDAEESRRAAGSVAGHGSPSSLPALARPVLLAAASGVGIGLAHPFDIPPLASVVATLFVWEWFRARRFPKGLGSVGLAFGLLAGAPAFYQMSIAWRVPEFQAIHLQNVMRYAHWWSAFDQLDLYGLLAIAGLPFLLRDRRRPPARFVFCWVAASVATLHVPLPFQRRMIEGLPIACAFAVVSLVEGAVVGPLLRLLSTKTRLSRSRIRLIRHGTCLVVLLLLLPRTLWVVYDRSVGVFGRPNDQYYVRVSEVEALDWLGRHSDWREAVWAPFRRDNRVPFLSGNRAFIGHGVMTPHVSQKKQWTEALFSFRLPVRDFRRIVQRYNVRYVYWTEGDRDLDSHGRDFATYDPETLGAPIYDNGYAKIFRVKVRNPPPEG